MISSGHYDVAAKQVAHDDKKMDRMK